MMQLYQISVKRLYKFSIQSLLSGMDQSCFGETFILSEQIILSLFNINFIYKLRVCVCVTFEKQLALVIRCSALTYFHNKYKNLYERIVVYLDQHLGAAHFERWSKYPFSVFLHVFTIFFAKIKKNDAKLHFIFSYPPAS